MFRFRRCDTLLEDYPSGIARRGTKERDLMMKLRTAILILLAVVVPAAGKNNPKTEIEYFAILLAGKKIGYGSEARNFRGGTVETVNEMNMSIARAGMVISIKMSVAHVETTKGKPISFHVVREMSGQAQEVSGRVVAGGKINVVIKVGGQSTKRTLNYPKGALMSYGLQRLAKKKGLKEGTTYKCKLFDEDTFTAIDTTIVMGPKKTIDLLGRVANLTQVSQTLKVPQGQMTAVNYVDQDFEVRKSIIPLLGMKMELIACQKAYAISPSEGVPDFFDKLAVKSPRPLNLNGTKSITYHLEALNGVQLSIPEMANQIVKKTSDGAVVRVASVKAPKNASFPYKGKKPALLEATKPSQNVQSNEKRIKKLAAKAVGSTKNAAQAVQRIEQFVHKYINNKNLSVGYASALEVAQSREGDCTEHAVLTAALCRAVGIPAKVLFGIAYVKDWHGKKEVFLPHAWVIANVGGTWVPLDASLGSAGVGRIILASGDGDAADFFGMMNTLGNFEITKADVKSK